MHYQAPITLLLITALASSAATAQVGLSFERAAGLGLKAQPASVWSPLDTVFGTTATHAWGTLRPTDYALYSGGREVSTLGLRATESYSGIVYSGAGWGASFEAAYTGAPRLEGATGFSPLAPRRYAFTGQLHTSLSESRIFSVGLKYRVYDTDSGLRYGTPGDLPVANGYSLGYAPSYQVQMSYQYSAASAFGMALGREVETFTPFVDPSATGPRQLSFTGQHWLTPSWALSYDILSHDVASPLRLQGLRLGVRYRW